jgi:mannosylglycerate hydrolase
MKGEGAELTVHVISHNHWDREWIFTAHYTNRWLPPFFANLFSMLEREPEYRFVLDGQTVILEDYLAQLPAPEAEKQRQRLAHFVQRGQLLIGPAYLQPDWSLVSGESLVRNLMVGHQIAAEFGQVMKVGWMLDNFGQIAQAPQIYQGFGIDGVFVWRGVDPGDPPRTEFWWEAPDGSRVLAIYLINSYRNGMVLSLTREIARERIEREAHALAAFAATPHVLLMNGYEQVPWPDDVLPIIKEFNRGSRRQTRGEMVGPIDLRPRLHCRQSTPPEYLAAVRAASGSLPVLGGYFYSGRHMPVLKGVFSSRSHLKLLNNQCQRELERWTEPMATIAWTLGADYPAEKIARLWKRLMLNHAHDDMCGCCIDKIAQEMEARFESVLETSTDLTEESLRAISQSIHTFRADSWTALIVFNPSTRERSEVVSFALELPQASRPFRIVDGAGEEVRYQIRRRHGSQVELSLLAEGIPSLGYKSLYVQPGNPGKKSAAGVRADAQSRTLENPFLRLTIQEDGTFDLLDKETGQAYHQLGYFEDGGDAGDTYDYSWPTRDLILTSLGKKAQVKLLEEGPLVARFRVEIEMDLPEELSPDRQQRSEQTRPYPLVSDLELSATARRVEIKTRVRNVVKDHRLRVMFPSEIDAEYCFAEEPFDIARLAVRPPEQIQAPSRRLQGLMPAGGYTEPMASHPFQNFIDYSDGRRGLAIISRRGTEFEILPAKGTIALTLLRCVGWLAREDLLTRQGDVGPHIFTPEAQCLGDHEFYYAIYPHQGGWAESTADLEAQSHNLPLRVVQKFGTGSLPDRLSFVRLTSEVEGTTLRLTALKRAETGDGIVVRYFNARSEPIRGELSTWWEMAGGVQKTNLLEEMVEELPVERGPQGEVVSLLTRAGEIVTLRLRLWPSYRREGSYGTPPIVLPSLPLSQPTPAIEFPPLLTEDDLQAEHQRVTETERQLLEAKAEVFTRKDLMERMGWHGLTHRAELQKKELAVSTLTRQLHEAQISEMINRQLLINTQIESALGQIGEEMSWARTKKRAGEYLLHHYQEDHGLPVELPERSLHED